MDVDASLARRSSVASSGDVPLSTLTYDSLRHHALTSIIHESSAWMNTNTPTFTSMLGSTARV